MMAVVGILDAVKQISYGKILLKSQEVRLQVRKVVDARGLSGSYPVVLTRRALEDKKVDQVVTIVDNNTAVENIEKFIADLKLFSSIDEKGELYYINIVKDLPVLEKARQRSDTIALISSTVLGEGNDQLGDTLMKSFIYTLTQMIGDISTVIFINSGVLFTTAGSEIIEHIKLLEENGVEVCSCSSSLDFYNLVDKLQVGTAINMFIISEKLLRASKVINL